MPLATQTSSPAAALAIALVMLRRASAQLAPESESSPLVLTQNVAAPPTVAEKHKVANIANIRRSVRPICLFGVFCPDGFIVVFVELAPISPRRLRSRQPDLGGCKPEEVARRRNPPRSRCLTTSGRSRGQSP